MSSHLRGLSFEDIVVLFHEPIFIFFNLLNEVNINQIVYTDKKILSIVSFLSPSLAGKPKLDLISIYQVSKQE